MMAAREKDQSDFDLERFVEMFDEALTSHDPRVIDALRSLMMMVTLTKAETYNSPYTDRQRGPLRRLYEDLGHLNSRLSRLEEEHHRLLRQLSHETEASKQYDYRYEKYSLEESIKKVASIDQDVLNKMATMYPVKGALPK